MSAKTVAPLLRSRWAFRTEDYPLVCTLADDGATLAIGAADGTLTVLDAETGTSRHRWVAHAQGVQSAAFGEELLATGGQDGRVRLWNTRDRALIADLPAGASWVEQVAFSPNGGVLAWAAGRCAQVVSAAGKPVAQLAHPATITALEFSPDGALLALAGNGAVVLYRCRDWQTECVLTRTLPLLTLAWSPDGRVLACGAGDSSVHFWRLDGEEACMSGIGIRPFRGARVAWLGTTLAIGGDDEISLWSFSGAGPEGTRPRELQAELKAITQLAAAPDGARVAAGGKDGRVLVWNAHGGAAPIAAAKLDDTICALLWHPTQFRCFAADIAGNVRALSLT